MEEELPTTENLATEVEEKADLKSSAPASKVLIKESVTEELVANSGKFSKIFRPFIKPPVRKTDFKLSTPVIPEKRPDVKESSKNEGEIADNKLEITSGEYHSLMEQSVIDGKKIFIKFGAKWCLPCKIMDANVFPDEQIQQLLLENYHTLTVDVDNLDGINLRQFYNVGPIPSFIILDSQQNEIGRYVGSKKIEELRSILGGDPL